MNPVSRRKFLKISAATIGVATTGSAIVKGAETLGNNIGKDVKGVQKIPTYCDICFWKCGAIAYVNDGSLWKVEGNPENPLSRGRLCPRGTGGVGAHYDPDRLKSPLIRRNERGRLVVVE
jgi:thiosulfate reductase/polysulfide reductase chain A